jgi:FkbM family methyltransferase
LRGLPPGPPLVAILEKAMPVIAGHPIFSRFTPQCEGQDFIGSRIRSEFHGASLCDVRREGKAPLPPFDEEYFEWIDLLESVDQAQGSYTFVELGAGYGRWSVRAALAAAQRGLSPVCLVAVEGEPTHFEWLKLHFADNGLDPSRHTLIRAAVSDAEGETFFHVGRPAEWYGQCIACTDTGYKVPKMAFWNVLNPLGRVDLIDLDVQGEELKCCSSDIGSIDAKVKRLHIGTHSSEIEAGLRTLLNAHGWKCLVDYPLAQANETPYGTFQFVDGVQSWVNPRLCSL